MINENNYKQALFYCLSDDLSGSAYGDHKMVSVKTNMVLFNSIKKMSKEVQV